MALKGNRPLIKVRSGELPYQATAGELALLAAGAPFYVRGASIVRPVCDELHGPQGRTVLAHRLVEVDIDMMIDHLSRAAVWKRYDKSTGRWLPMNAPRNVAATVLARDGEWQFPRITGVISAPTLRPDGSLLVSPGYDSDTGLLLVGVLNMPPISDHPTKAEAFAALRTLNALLDDFPFTDEASRSVALSGLITSVVRGALPVAPLHAITAPVAGSGKSYIVDLVCAISTGQPAPVLSAGKNEDETSKRICAALLDGQSIVSIDNVNGELGGDLLCQAVERPVVALRPLGHSDLVKVESRATWFATGNNIHLIGDMTRRTIQCALDPALERPELREFRGDPLSRVLDDRGNFVAAALTIVRAYLDAGRPEALPPLASFERWSTLVRSPLVWLGLADPVLTMEKARQHDPVTSDLGALLSAINAALGEAAKTTGEIVRFANELKSRGSPNDELFEALLTVAPGRTGEPDPRRLGRYFTKVSGRVVEGLKMCSIQDNHSKQRLWSVRSP